MELDESVATGPLLQMRAGARPATALVRAGGGTDQRGPFRVGVMHRIGEYARERVDPEAGLHRDVDELPAPAAHPVMMGKQHPAGKVCCGVEIGVLHAHAQRWSVTVAVGLQRATGGPEHEVGLGVTGLGAVVSESGERAVHECRSSPHAGRSNRGRVWRGRSARRTPPRSRHAWRVCAPGDGRVRTRRPRRSRACLRRRCPRCSCVVADRGVARRAGEPPGGSTCTTSAPKSANTRPANSPRSSQRSSTR